MTMVEVLLPRPSAGDSFTGSDGSTFDVAGKVVAVVNNGWGSFEDLEEAFDRLLREGYGVKDVVHFKNNKHAAETNFGAPPEFLDEIAAVADAAISGLGNCGGCTAWTCDTACELTRRGVFSAGMVTGLYRMLAEFNVANTNKMPDQNIVFLSDGFEYTDKEQLEDAASFTLATLFGQPIAGRTSGTTTTVGAAR